MGDFTMTFVNDCLTESMINYIGHITAEWALMEAELSVAIWDYCAMDREQGLCITTALGAMAKINMFSALAARYFRADNPKLKEVEDLTKRLVAFNAERNSVVHHLWKVDRIGKSIYASKTSTKSRKLTDVKVQKSDDELSSLVLEIDRLYNDLRQFQLNSGVLPPSRTKSP